MTENEAIFTDKGAEVVRGTEKEEFKKYNVVVINNLDSHTYIFDDSLRGVTKHEFEDLQEVADYISTLLKGFDFRYETHKYAGYSFKLNIDWAQDTNKSHDDYIALTVYVEDPA